MKQGEHIVVDGVRVQLWSRAPSTLTSHLYDLWWVIREGPQDRIELWAIGRERKHGRFTRNWRFVGRYSWDKRTVIYETG